MNSDDLDRLIDKLEDLLPDDPGIFGIGVRRQDWRPFWALAKDIQSVFNAGVRYPTRELRSAAWERFNGLRSEAVKRAESEREHLYATSKNHRDIIFDKCSGIGWSFNMDAMFLDHTTVEEMKARSKYLGQAMRHLSEYKAEMLGEHKRECFERIQQIKEEQEDFWEHHRQARAEKRSDRAERCRANLEKNQAAHRKATEALERNRERAGELRSKIDATESEKWSEIWSGWLAETEEKIDDIESHVARLEEWIEEDEKRLSELE